MTPTRGKPASLAGVLALAWMIWTAFRAWHELHAQRYPELGYTHLAALSVQEAVVRGLPYLIVGVPLVILLMRLVRHPRGVAAVAICGPLVILAAALLPQLNVALRGSLPDRWLRAAVLGGATSVVLAIGLLLALVPGQRGTAGRLCTRFAAFLQARIGVLRDRGWARLLGRRALCGVAGLGAAAGLVWPVLSRPDAPRGPSVVILLIDTLRADHLGCYGYGRETSPNVDRWAAGATIFDAGIAQASWTKPSVASLFTSLYASVHRTGSGLEERREIRNGRVVMVPAPPGSPDVRAALPRGLVTLAEVFREAGYSTAAFLANGIVSAEEGYAQGFETYRITNDRQLTRQARAWLARRRKEAFFLYLHYMAPHAPYEPPEAFDRYSGGRRGIDIADSEIRDSINFVGSRRLSPEEVADLIDPYDGEILFADSQVQQILEELARLDLADRTVVILTADHGEEFVDHGWVWHSSAHLYEELVRVPLIIDLPGDTGSGRRVSQTVMQIDLAPTLFELAGLAVPAEMQGRSLAGLWRNETLPARAALTETIDWGWRQAIRSDSLKLIHDREASGLEYYDLRDDPREQRPNPPLQAPTARALLDSLEALHARNAGHLDPGLVGSSEGISAAERERLRSLGYIR